MSEQNQKRERWGSRMGIILAVMGSAIGLGNFLRFPGLVAQYGGGHFMVPYITALLILGLPIAWAEWSMGRMGGSDGYHSSPGIFRQLMHKRLGPYVGLLGLIIPIGIYMYYVYIESWCLYYAWAYLSGDIMLGKNPEAYSVFFSNYTGMNADGALFQDAGGGTLVHTAVWMMLACFVINFTIIYQGLSRGIELISKIAMPVLFLCAFVVLVRVLTLGTPDPEMPENNLLNGLGYMWNAGVAESTDAAGHLIPAKSFWQALLNGDMWLKATSQIFFSLSVGFGIIITYSSYLRKKDDVLLNGTTSAAGNIFAEVALGGMITVPAAIIFLGSQVNFGSTFGLGFVALPNVFANMPLGQFFGFLWFGLLFLAALTSSLSMLQPAIAFFEEGLGVGRKVSTSILAFITLCGAMFFVVFSKDAQALDFMDFWVGNVFIYIMATIIVIVFGWVIGVDKGMDHAQAGSHIIIPRIFRFIIKYVSPVYLIVVFVAWLIQEWEGYYEKIAAGGAPLYTGLFILLLLGFLLWQIVIASSRWKALDKSREES